MSDRWLDLIQTVRSECPTDLDTLIDAKITKRRGSHAGLHSYAATVAPSARLWSMIDADLSFIGVRVLRPLEDCAPIALRLAAAAVERNVIPVILTTLGTSGFERFGFRTERLFGATPELLAACEAELARFWNFAIVINAEDVVLLG